MSDETKVPRETIWNIITPTFKAGRLLAWSDLDDPMVAVQNLQINLSIDLTDYAGFRALLSHLSLLPGLHSLVRSLRIRLKLSAGTRAQSTLARIAPWTEKLRIAVEDLHWPRPVDVYVAGIDAQLRADEIHRRPLNWNLLCTTTAAVSSGPMAPPTSVAPSTGRSRTQLHGGAETSQSVTADVYPDPQAMWTTVSPNFNASGHLISWHMLQNPQSAKAILYLQVDLFARWDHTMYANTDPYLLTVVPLSFPNVRFLRIRIVFAEEILTQAYIPWMAEWIHRHLYQTLARVQWSHRVEVLMAVNDLETPYTYELYDAAIEAKVDVATSLLHRRGAWETIFSILPPASTMNTRNPLRRTTRHRGLRNSLSTARSVEHDERLTLTQLRRPPYPGYDRLSGYDSGITYGEQSSLNESTMQVSSDSVLNHASQRHEPSIGDVNTTSDEAIAAMLQGEEYSAEVPYRDSHHTMPTDSPTKDNRRGTKRRRDEGDSAIFPCLPQSTIQDLEEQDQVNAATRQSEAVDPAISARREQEEHAWMLEQGEDGEGEGADQMDVDDELSETRQHEVTATDPPQPNLTMNTRTQQGSPQPTVTAPRLQQTTTTEHVQEVPPPRVDTAQGQLHTTGTSGNFNDHPSTPIAATETTVTAPTASDDAQEDQDMPNEVESDAESL